MKVFEIRIAVAGGLLFLLLFVSGVLLISNKAAGHLLPAIHTAALLLMVVSAILLYAVLIGCN